MSAGPWPRFNRLSLLLPFALPFAAFSDESDFMDAAVAYEQRQYARCSDILLAMDHSALPMPINGELLLAECLGAAGRMDEAIAYLERKLASGRIDPGQLRSKDRPGLNAIRRSPQWPSLIARAESLERERLAGLDRPLREELLARAAQDQRARQAALEAGGDEHAWKPVEPVDRENRVWLKAVVAAKGWPGISMVGEDGAKAAWLLVQHAGTDPDFQALVLSLMEAALAKGDVAPDDFALLTDRVLLAQGKPQRYGTQFQPAEDGTLRLRPSEDEAGLDARRRVMGLPPLADYRRMLERTYGRPVE